MSFFEESKRSASCGFHDTEANKLCFTSSDHHALKYHDPSSEFYLGEECVACPIALIEKRLREVREYNKRFL